jgi:hypothetical protein
MKKPTILFLLIALCIFACKPGRKQGFLNTNNIRTQLFTINPEVNNTIKGARGGLFNIPSGAFEGTSPVTIELKEIYSPIEILTSGLTTESNGELLESGGMFYINAKRDGRELELKKPIDGTIPTNYINDSMKLFKGEQAKDGKINWDQPEILSPAMDSNKLCLESGKILFKQNCASCYSVFKKLTGPALAGADKRVTRDMYYQIVHNPAAFARKNQYFNCLIHRYNGVLMTSYPMLHDEEIDCIIKYINNEAEKRPDLSMEIDTSFLGVEGCDIPINTNYPCGIDTFYIDTLPKGNVDFNLPPMHL